MYSFYDEKYKIQEIQRYLFVTESGNFDDKTREAVILVQRNNGIIENGKIDRNTFDIIYNEYEKTRQKDIISKKHPNISFPLKLGTYNEAIMEVNKMLFLLSRFYGIQTNLVSDDYYGERTENVLSELSEIYAVERNVGEIDEDTYMMITKDFRGMRIFGD